jgi:hypothetical protein
MKTSPVARLLIDSTQPLLRRTTLLPSESLASVLERLTQLNFYDDLCLIRAVGRERLAALNIVDDLTQPTRLETFQQLATLTQLSLDELYAASDQRFAAWLDPLDQTAQPMLWLDRTTRPRVNPRWARAQLRTSEATQFCPMCLNAAAYHRMSWIPRAAAICLEHLCLLTDHCPRCWKPTTVTDLINRRCLTCEADLRHARRVSIAHDSLSIRSQQAIQHWFGVAEVPAETLAACHLPPQPPRVLYQLLQLFAQQLMKGQAEWPNLPSPLNGLANSIAATIEPYRALRPEQAYFLYRSAFAALLDWPEGLHRWLDAYGGYDATASRTLRRPQRIREVQRDWLNADWGDAPLAFVQREILNYVLKRQVPLAASAVRQLKDVSWFVEQSDLWTEECTAQALDLSVADLRRFYPRGSLADCYWPHSQANLIRFKRTGILAVKQCWTEGWSLKDASSWLGVKVEDVQRLVEVGLLSAHGEVNELAADQGVFNPRAVRDFFQQIVTHLQPYPESRGDLILMIEAVSEVHDLGIDLAVLLQSVLAGVLPAYPHHLALVSLYHIDFNQAIIYGLPDQLYAARGWISADRFAHDYGFAPYLIREWSVAGQIQPTLSFSRRDYFDQQQLKELAAQHGFVAPIVRPVRTRRNARRWDTSTPPVSGSGRYRTP